MTVTVNKHSIVGVVLVLLAGCSFNNDKAPVSSYWNIPQGDHRANIDIPDVSDACVPEAGPPFHLRKAILVAGTLGATGHARDLPGLAHLTSKRLQTHLDALDRFSVLATHDSSFESMALGTDAIVRQLGQEYNSQFVVKLEIEDLTVHSTGGWLSKLSGGRLPKLINDNAKRNVLIKLYVYDTEYGALFHSQRFQETVSGDVVGYPGNGNTVTTPWFKTDLGTTVDDLINDISLTINEKLACVPFSTEVIAVKGDDIHINAGFLQGIRPGETLRIYRHRDKLVPTSVKKRGENDGWIKVNAVFPNYSVASGSQEQANRTSLYAGDVVRAW